MFGIADFSAEAIATLAVSDPTMLTATIRKLKFLKSHLITEFPLRRAAVYSLFDSQSDIKNADHPLCIVLIDNHGQLFNCPIGSTSALQCGSLVTLQDDSNTSPIRQTCLDVALLDYGTSGIPNRNGEKEEDKDVTAHKLAIALYAGGTLCILSLNAICVLRTFRLDLEHSPVTRISLLSPFVDFQSKSTVVTRHQSTSVWGAVVVGVESVTNIGRATSLFTLLHNTRTETEFLALQLGACDMLTQNIIPTSTPGNCIFATSKEKSGSEVSVGYRISENVENCVASILHGLETDGSSGESSSEHSAILGPIIGRILRLSCTNLQGNEYDSDARDLEVNPFDVEEILDLSLESMTSLSSCGEVGCLLNVLLVCVYDPPEGFIDKMIDAAEVSTKNV